jgi:hypothetical protein
VLLLVPSLALAKGGAEWERALPKPRAAAALEKTLAAVRAAAKRGKKPIVMVDIDDTIVDGRARVAKAAELAGLPFSARTRDTEGLYRGLDRDARALKRSEFGKHYFGKSLQRLDAAQRGAPQFLDDVRAAGGRVVYVTGRWESERGKTKRLLSRLDLAPARDGDLRMNPSSSMHAAEFKQLLARQLKREGQVVAYFDNESKSVRNYTKELSRAQGYRLRTFSFDPDRAAPPKGVKVIRDFSH